MYEPGQVGKSRRIQEARGIESVGLEMPMKCNFVMTLCCFVLLTSGFMACSSSSQKNGNQIQARESQDQKTRDTVAHATEKAKQASKQMAKKADEAAKDLEHKAEIVKEGVKQGWNQEPSGRVNLNSASEADLQNLPGITQEDAQKIINGRPYTSTNDLLSKGIVSKNEFGRIQSRITVNK